MAFGGGVVALTSMRSSAVCGVVDFVGISLPKCLGSAPRLLGRIRLLLRLGSSERSVGTFWVSSACFSGSLCTGVWSFAYLQLMLIHKMYLSICVMVTCPWCCVLQYFALRPVSVCFYLGFSLLVLKLPKPFHPEPCRVYETSVRSAEFLSDGMKIFTSFVL